MIHGPLVLSVARVAESKFGVSVSGSGPGGTVQLADPGVDGLLNCRLWYMTWADVV